MDATRRQTTEKGRFVHHGLKHTANRFEFGDHFIADLLREVAAIQRRIEPVLRLLLLAIRIGQLAHEVSFVPSFGPSLGYLGTDRTNRPTALIRERVSLLFGKCLGQLEDT